MFTRAIGPGQGRWFAEEGDPVVLTDLCGRVVWGPHPAPPQGQQLVIDHRGPRLDDFCWGVLNPDATLACQSGSCGPLWRNGRITLDFDLPADDYLTVEDRSWLRRMAKIAAGDEPGASAILSL
jgi:hypothetical protein